MGELQAADVLTTVKQDQRIREGKEPMQGEEWNPLEHQSLKYETKEVHIILQPDYGMMELSTLEILGMC